MGHPWFGVVSPLIGSSDSRVVDAYVSPHASLDHRPTCRSGESIVAKPLASGRSPRWAITLFVNSSRAGAGPSVAAKFLSYIVPLKG